VRRRFELRDLKALADNGAQIIYGPMPTPRSTIAAVQVPRKWAQVGRQHGAADPKSPSRMPCGHRRLVQPVKVYAALHNHAAYYNPAFDPPPGPNTPLKVGERRVVHRRRSNAEPDANVHQRPTAKNTC